MNDYKYDWLLAEDYASKVYKDLQTKQWKPTFPTKVTPKFKVGDRVRLNSGTAEIEVTGTYALSPHIDGKYVNSDSVITRRHQDDFVPYDGEKKMTNANKLYTWKDNLNHLDLYGHYLTTNSQGDWVMEVRGSGAVVAVPKNKVEAVLPYTISVKFQDSGTTYSYISEKDKFPVGFYLVKAYSHDGWQIAQVTAVDTKSAKATKEFAPIGKLAVDLY